MKRRLLSLILLLMVLAGVAHADPYWFTFNQSVVAGNDLSMAFTFADSSGTAQNISTWTFYYNAEGETSLLTGTVDLDSSAGTAISLSDSGSGTTDTATVNLTDTVTGALDAGRYKHELLAKISGEYVTIFRGRLTVVEGVASE